VQTLAPPAVMVAVPFTPAGRPDSEIVNGEPTASDAESTEKSPVSTGALTRTVNCAVARFPALSVAEHETEVEPTAKTVPLAGAHVTAGELGPTASVAVGEKLTDAPLPSTPAAETSWTLICGGVVSRTDTVNAAVAMLPAASVAVHDTLVAPTANREPLAGAHDTSGELGATSSVADGENVTVSPAALLASTVTFATVICGGVVSGFAGVTGDDAADAALVPTPFTASTVKVYAVPLVRPLTVQLVAGAVERHVWPPGLAVTT